MQKEIFEQPESVVNTMRGRVNFDDYTGNYVSYFRVSRGAWHWQPESSLSFTAFQKTVATAISGAQSSSKNPSVYYSTDRRYTQNSQIHRDRWQISGYQGQREGTKVELLFNSYRIPVWEDKEVPEMIGSGGSTTV